VLAATNVDLRQAVRDRLFREDLYYRLNVVHIEIPPLSRRREDIPLLVAHFLAQIARESGVRKIYAPEAVELLATADWPGNIRQLQNVVRQNVALSQTPIIPVELVQQSLGGSPGRLPSFDEARDEFTRSYLSQILQITGGNVSQAARLARRYSVAGAAALSVLTEPRRFAGSIAHLCAAARWARVPVLRKDFLVAPLQVLEALARGLANKFLHQPSAALSQAREDEREALARAIGMLYPEAEEPGEARDP